MTRRFCLLVGAILLAPACLLAQSSPTTAFSVSFSLLNQCTVSAAPVDFGLTAPNNTFNAEGTITVNCSNGVPYEIKLDGGMHSANLIRHVEDPTDATRSFEYYLYKDSSRQDEWWDWTGSTQNGTGTGADQAHLVYGKLIIPPFATAGDATDTVNVTVNF